MCVWAIVLLDTYTCYHVIIHVHTIQYNSLIVHAKCNTNHCLMHISQIVTYNVNCVSIMSQSCNYEYSLCHKYHRNAIDTTDIANISNITVIPSMITVTSPIIVRTTVISFLIDKACD